jgi:hypothetical protein
MVPSLAVTTLANSTYFKRCALVSASFLEIVELANGDIVLQRADGDGEPIVNISFSDETKAYMPEGRMDIARAMIHAGIQAVAEMSGAQADIELFSESPDESSEHTVH